MRFRCCVYEGELMEYDPFNMALLSLILAQVMDGRVWKAFWNIMCIIFALIYLSASELL